MALQTQENYNYDELEYGKECVRLLDLLPGSDGDEIQCRFKQAQLSDQIHFTAVSYVCGKADMTQSIILEDGRIAVRPNVTELLKTIRNEKTTQTLWIDAICIDSSSVKERNHQVQLMSSIYRAATSVLVWLGPEYDECSTLFSLINCSTGRMEACDIIEYIQSLNQKDQPGLWRALEHVCTRDYWGRMWIVQEVLLAKQITLRCGSAVTDGGCFLNFLYEFASANFSDQVSRSLQNKIIGSFAYKLLKRWQGQRGKRSGSLQSLIEEYGESACTDTRDKVYALLGLAEDHQGKKIVVVDYSQSVTALFLVVMSFTQPQSPLAFGQSLLRVLQVEAPSIEALSNSGRSLWYPFEIEKRIPLACMQENMWGAVPAFFFSIAKQNSKTTAVQKLIHKACDCLERHSLERHFDDTPAEFGCVYAFVPRAAYDVKIHRADLIIGKMPDCRTYLVIIAIRWEDFDSSTHYGSSTGSIQTHSSCIARLCPKMEDNLEQHISFHSAGEFLDCTIDDPAMLTAAKDRKTWKQTSRVCMSPALLMRLMTFT